MKKKKYDLNEIKVHPDTLDDQQPLARFLITLFGLFEDELISGLKKTPYKEVTRTDLNTIRYIHPRGSTVVEIAARSGVTKQAASKQLAGLASRGYVTKDIDQTDGRALRVNFTRKGRGLVENLVHIIAGIEERYQKTIGVHDYQLIKKAIQVLILSYEKPNQP